MSKKRVRALIIIISIAFILIAIRLLDIQVIHYSFYKSKAENQHRRIIPLAAERGDIYDRNGELFATSIDLPSIYINPKEFKNYEKLEQVLKEKITRFSNRRLFGWVKRKIDPALADKVKSLNLPGVYFLTEKKRVYPKGRMASQVLGFVGLDNEGLSGIELGMEDYLKGEESSIITESDPAGYELLSKRESKKKKDSSGASIYLTIDESIQFYAERELEKIIKQYSAVSGMIIVADVENGEILALAGKPDFDPNNYSKSNPRNWRCKAVDVYEPGSTFKTITAAIGLDAGVVNLESQLKVLNQLEIGGKIIKNSHNITWKGSTCSLFYMLEQSINTVVAQISIKLGKDRFYNKIRDLGFGDLIDVGLPGESRGIVRDPSTWYKPDIAMISFGQSIAVTPLQLCAAYIAIANGGTLIKPQLIKKIESDDQKFVKTSRLEEVRKALSKKTSEDTIKLLESFVLHGSGRKAQIKGFKVGGKTGTAQKAERGIYVKGRYIASFIGFAPLSKPKIVALVLIDEPKGVIWGETVCGPGFSQVVENTLRYLSIKPDNLTGEAKTKNVI